MRKVHEVHKKRIFPSASHQPRSKNAGHEDHAKLSALFLLRHERDEAGQVYAHDREIQAVANHVRRLHSGRGKEPGGLGVRLC